MDEKDERKRCRSECDNSLHQISRPKRRKLDVPSINAFLDAKKLNLGKLPSNCLQLILSFTTYEKVSQLRLLCQKFNTIGKKLLDQGHRELEKQLKSEIERAETRILFPINLRSSYDTLHYLNDLHEAINICAKTYEDHVNYFVAGKLLDEANCLLKKYNSSRVVPYFPEYVCCEQKPKLSLLAPIVVRCEKARRHFKEKILGKFIIYYYGKGQIQIGKKFLALRAQVEQNHKKIQKTNLLKNQRRKINCGNDLSQEFLNLILKLNEKVLDLTQQLVNNTRARTTTTTMRKSPNLATLPLSCTQNIVSYFSRHNLAKWRIVSTSFNNACKKELNEEFEKQKRKLQLQIGYREALPTIDTEINLVKDLRDCLQLCSDNNKCYLGSDNYFFTAGKALDEAKQIWNSVGRNLHDTGLSISLIKHLVYKAIAHLKFNVVPQHLSWTQNHIYAPDFIMNGNLTNIEKESHLNLEEIEKLVEEAGFEIEKQNERNRKFLKVISGLKKKVVVLNKEILERVIVLNKLK